MSERTDFSAEYAKMADGELLAIARDYESLTDPAQIAIRGEFARRKLEPPLIAEEDELEWGELVTVKTFLDLSEALVAQSVLESSGIKAVVFDENLVRLYWRAPNMVGGARLKVPAADRDAASELLAQPVSESIQYSADKSYQQPRCPDCGSRQIGKLTLLDSMGGGPDTWRCEDCSARWERGDD